MNLWIDDMGLTKSIHWAAKMLANAGNKFNGTVGLIIIKAWMTGYKTGVEDANKNFEAPKESCCGEYKETNIL